MGGKRKFRLSVHRKNEERKKLQQKRSRTTDTSTDTPSTSTTTAQLLLPNSDALVSSIQLHQKLIQLSLPPQWIIITAEPLTLCKMTVCSGKPAKAFATISIDHELQWTVHYLEHNLCSLGCSMFSVLPLMIDNVTVVQRLMQLLDNLKPCTGNNDDAFITFLNIKS